MVLVGFVSRVDGEGCCEVSRGKVVIATGSSCLPIGSRSSIIGTELLLRVLQVGLMGCDTLIGNHGVIRVIQMIQTCNLLLYLIMVQRTKLLLLKVLMREDIVIAAQVSHHLLSILIYNDRLTKVVASPLIFIECDLTIFLGWKFKYLVIFNGQNPILL